jgi:hypothetical protein
MSDIEPVVRHMLLCDDVQRDEEQPNRFNVLGLANAIRFAPESEFPVRQRLLTVLLLLSGGRGSGQVHLVGVHADSNEAVFQTPPRTVHFAADPVAVQALIFRVLDVPFPQPGVILDSVLLQRAGDRARTLAHKVRPCHSDRRINELP